MELSQILGWTATFIFTVTYIPQIVKTIKTRTVDGLSFLFLALPWVGNVVALYYSILIKQRPLQIKYTLALILLTISLYFYIKVKFDHAQTRKNAGA